MAQLSIKGEEAALNAVFRGTNPVYLALATNTAGTIDDTTVMTAIVEPTDTSYARKQITFASPIQENSKTTIKNSVQIDYNPWTAIASAPITYALIVDSSTKGAGNILAYFQLGTALTPDANQPIRVSVNNLSISLD